MRSPLWLMVFAGLACQVLGACDGCRSRPAGADRARSGIRPGVRADDTARLHYRVRPGAELRTLTVSVCMRGRVPARLDAQITASRRALVTARRSPGGAALTPDDDGLDLSGLAPGACVELAFDVDRAIEHATRRRSIRRYGRDLSISPDYWLWRPSQLDDAELTASFDLPEGMAAMVPWPRADPDRRDSPYRIPATTFQWAVQGALGYFEPEHIEVAGARLHLAMLGDTWQADPDLLRTWVRTSARAVSLLYGEFPVPEAQVLILPVDSDRPVFGWATQGGGASVALMTGTRVTAESLRHDWVAVHELLHLGMPVIEDQGNWLSEGLVTYYEPLLRARAGVISAAEAWEILHDGFGRGQKSGSGRTLREESESMAETHQYWRVYWSGAAMGLLADVRMRRHGTSLDRQMQRMRDCCLHSGETWETDALLAASAPDRGPSLADVAARYLDQRDFPDVAPAYRALGLSFDPRGELTAGSASAKSALRDSLTATD